MIEGAEQVQVRHICGHVRQVQVSGARGYALSTDLCPECEAEQILLGRQWDEVDRETR